MLLSKYICIRIKRNPHIVFIFIAIVISFVWLVNEMGTIGVAQAAKLENMYNDFNVRCVLSKPNGSRDNLLISNTYISYFTDPSYGLSQHLKDICFKRTLYYELPVYSHNIGNNELHNIGNNELLIMQLVGISRLEAEPIISDENGISIDFINGYTEEALQNDSLICVVNEWLLFNLGLQPGNNIKISAIDRQDNFNNVVEFIDTEMLIIGSVKGGYVYTIYCPWETAVSLAEMSSGIPPITELMGAVIIDNKHINEFKEIASKYFTYVEAMAQSSTHGFALTVYDSILIQSSLKVQKNILWLSVLRPIILTMSLLVGFISSFILTKNRKLEFSIMRSLGTKRIMVFLMVFLEQVLLGILGMSIAIIFFYMIKSDVKAIYIDNVLFYVFFISGSAIAVYQTTQGNIMHSFKTLE